MIIDLQKGSFAKGLINYHEKKVESGRGLMIMDTTLSRNKEERIARLIETSELNNRVRKNKFVHISISFPAEDRVGGEQQLKVAEFYLKKMGYVNTPLLMYEHSDTKHHHFHIVTTTVDLDGKKVAEFKDFSRSQEISREIENVFGLKTTEYSKQENLKLQEINSKKFKIYKGLEKISGSEEAQDRISKILNPEDLSRTISEKLSDRQIFDLVKLRGLGENQFNDLYRIIRQFDAEYKTEKEKLRERLNFIKDISKTRDEFMLNIEAQGLYVRKIAKGENTYSLTYGVPNSSFYVNDKDLPLNLRYDYLFTDRKITQQFDVSAQKNYLKKIVGKHLKFSLNLDDFENRLKQSRIHFEYDSNKRGIYGISFSSKNLKESILFKGSDIGASWNYISKHFSDNKETSILPEQNQKNIPPKEKQVAPEGTKLAKNVSRSLDTSQEDEEAKARKKNKDQDMNIE